MPNYTIGTDNYTSVTQSDITFEAEEASPRCSDPSCETCFPQEPLERIDEQEITPLPDSFNLDRGYILGLNAVVDLHVPVEELEDNGQLTNPEFFTKRYKELVEWCNENNFVPCLAGNSTIRCGIEGDVVANPFGFYVSFPTKFKIRSSEEPIADSVNLAVFLDKTSHCPDCSTETPFYDLVCPNCDRLNYCSGHSGSGFPAFSDVLGREQCANCAELCTRCNEHYAIYDYEVCEHCESFSYCVSCDQLGIGYTSEGYCEECVPYQCISCGTEISRRDYERHGEACRACARGGNEDEEFDSESSIHATSLRIVPIPGREMIRRVGVEIEGANMRGGEILAAALYSENLSNQDTISGYHTGERGGFAHVEYDSTVDWEMVVGPVDMTDITQVRMLNKSINLLRDSIKAGHSKFDLRCGTHIHVSANQISLTQAYHLHILYAYLEDALFRLGAAKWKRHRALLNGDEYCMKMEKRNTKVEFANAHSGNRYLGLSFSNYFNGMLNSCECGAKRWGAWEECTCTLHKCTFEFRLFNATANTIKLHAYLALCQALVAKAISIPDIREHDAFPAMNFIEQEFANMPSSQQEQVVEKWKSRLAFISTELPLTPEEKESILYCIENSELESAKEAFVISEEEE